MHRTQILLEDWQHEALKALAEREGRSVSQLVRDILAGHLRRRRTSTAISAIEGIAETPHVAGRDHDRILYGEQQPSE